MSGSLGALSVTLELDGADNFTTTINRAGAALGSFTVNAQAGTQATNQTAAQMAAAAAGINNAAAALNAAATAAQRAGQGFAGAGAGIASAAGNIATLTVALGQARAAFDTVREVTTGIAEKIIKINASIESTVLLFKGLSSASTDVERTNEALGEFNHLMEQAATSPFRLDELGKAFVRLKSTGMQGAKETLDSLVDTISHFGGNDQNLQRAAYALQEMSGRGVISLQNLRRQLGQDIPQALEVMASGMNLTVGQLTQKVTKGTLESENAIKQFRMEAELLYGGSAVQKLDTYNGQIAVLTTMWQKLALVAGGMGPDGKYTEGSFFKNVTAQLAEFNRYLNSNEAKSFAISVNNALDTVVTEIVNVIKFFHEWGDAIVSVGAHLVEFAVLWKAVSAAAALYAAAVNPTTLVATTLSNLGNILRSVGSIGVTAFQAMVAPVVSYGSAVAGIVQSIGSASAGLTGFGAAAVSAVAPMVQLTVILAALAAPVAIIAGIALIASNLKTLEDRGNLAADAMKRIRQGDLSTSNEDTARTQIASIQHRADVLQTLIDKIEKLKAGGNGALVTQDFGAALNAAKIAPPPTQMKMVPGLDGEIELPAEINAKNVNDDPYVKYYNALKGALAQLKLDIANELKLIGHVGEDRNKAAGEDAGNVIVQDIKKNLGATMQAHYGEVEKFVAEMRKQLDGKQDNEALAQVGQLNAIHAEAGRQGFEEELIPLRKALAGQQTAMRDALAATDEDAKNRVDRIRATMDVLVAEIAKVETKQKEFAKDSGQIVTTDSSAEIEKRKKQLESMIQTMEARTEQLNAKAEGAVGTVAKLQQMLSDTGKFSGVTDDLKNRAIEAAKSLETAETADKVFVAQHNAQKLVDNGLTAENEKLKGYIERISNPDMPEAQRSFVNLSAKMDQALLALANTAGVTSEAMQTLKASINDALNVAQLNATLAVAEKLINEGDRARKSMLPPLQQEALNKGDRALQFAMQRQRLDPKVTPLAEGETAESRANVIARLNESEHNLNQKSDTHVAKIGAAAGAGAAKASENAMTALIAKTEQLRAEITGTRGEYEKIEALISRGKLGGNADAARAEAKEYDRLYEILKQVQVARQAEATLKSNAAQVTENVAEMRQINAELEGRGKLLGVEREIFDFKSRQMKEVGRVAAMPASNDSGVTQEELAKRVANANNLALDETSKKATEVALRETDANKTTAETIMKSVDTSLSHRRAAGLEEVADFANSQQRIIDLANLTAAERLKAETNLTAAINAKQLQVQRQTETALEKWVRENTDSEALMAKFGTDAFGQLENALSSFASTGKMNWTSLSDWAIKEISRITLSEGFATLLKAMNIGTGSGGSSLSGLFGTAISAVGGVFTGTASGSTGYDSLGNVGKGYYGPPSGNGVQFHSGGLVGSEGTARSIHSAMFENAPRYHTGGYIKNDEVPLVAQKGEAIFTAGQLGAIGKLNHSYGEVEGAVGLMAQSLTQMASSSKPPSGVSMGSMYDPSAQVKAAGSNVGNKQPNVAVNMNNQTGMGLSTQAGVPKFDGEQFVIDVVLKHGQQPGQLRNLIASGGNK